MFFVPVVWPLVAPLLADAFRGLAWRRPMSGLRHGSDCQCTRCRGFEPGNQLGRHFEPGNDLSVRHGAYATLRLAPRAAEIADEVRELVPLYRPADDVVVKMLALTMARIEAAEAALAQVDAVLGGVESDDEGRRRLQAYVPKADPAKLTGDFQRLRDDLKGWVRLARQLANDLGMTPTSRARLGVDVANARRAVTLTELAAEADEERRRAAGDGS